MSDHALEMPPVHDAAEADDSRSRLSLWGIVLVFVLLVGVVGLFLLDWLYHPEKFRIEEVEIHGRLEHLNPELVRTAVATELDGNYFSARLEDIEAAVRELPWVIDASVRRQWPSTLVVGVEEARPIAAWGADRWLDTSGHLVARESWDGRLPALDGPENMKEFVWRTFREWHGMFAAQGLSLDRLEFDERELWYMTLSLAGETDRHHPLEAKVEAATEPELAAETEVGAEAGEQPPAITAEVVMIVDNLDAGARIRRLISALNSQLIAEFPGMRSIDLRYPNGFAIHWVNDVPDLHGLTGTN